MKSGSNNKNSTTNTTTNTTSSETTRPVPNKKRQLVARLVLLVLYVGLGAIMIFTGKQHTILIDNKDVEGTSYTAIDGMSVQVDNLESSEYYAGDRDKAVVKGQNHKIKIEIFDPEQKIEKEISIPFGQSMVLLSIPKLVNGVEPYMEPFTVQEENASEQAQDQGTPNGEVQFGGTNPEAGVPVGGVEALVPPVGP